MGEPVDVDRFTPDGPRYDIASDEFLVLSVFKWERRKGWDILLRAWHKAQIDGVLVVVTNAYHSSADFARQMETYVTETLGDDRGLAALGKVKILSGLSDADMEALYRRADLVALPTRGEGWGRPHVEAMASGTPIVATNWSGPTAYLDASVGFPLAWTGLEPVGEGPFASHEWAAPGRGPLGSDFRRGRRRPRAVEGARRGGAAAHGRALRARRCSRRRSRITRSGYAGRSRRGGRGGVLNWPLGPSSWFAKVLGRRRRLAPPAERGRAPRIAFRRMATSIATCGLRVRATEHAPRDPSCVLRASSRPRGDRRAWDRFIRCKAPPRGRVDREMRRELSRLRRFGATRSHHGLVHAAMIASTFVSRLDGLKRPFRMRETYTSDVLKLNGEGS